MTGARHFDALNGAQRGLAEAAARVRGQTAALAYKGVSGCPYESGTPQAEAWQNAWQAMRKLMDEADAALTEMEEQVDGRR